MQSAKSILLNNTLITNSSEPPKRRVKNEFQAYAYKLAHDLNDLENLRIYLMLAKKIERPLMEQAYSFVADANSSEKGRLFLWKLKKIREMVDRERNKKNFTYSYVTEKQKEFKKVFANEIVLKQDSEINDELVENLKKYIIQNKKILMVGNNSRRIFKAIDNCKPKASVLDLSPELNKINKSKNTKVINKDILKNNYKDKYFDVVIINNYWNQIPVDSEITFLKELKRISKPNCIFLVIAKFNNKVDEIWKEFENRKKIYLYYTKLFTRESLFNQLEKFSLTLEKSYKCGDFELNCFLNSIE